MAENKSQQEPEKELEKILQESEKNLEQGKKALRWGFIVEVTLTLLAGCPCCSVILLWCI